MPDAQRRAWQARREGETEYGGKAGLIQPGEGVGAEARNGAPVSGTGHALTAQEERMVLAAFGKRTPSGETKLDGTPWPEGVAREEDARSRMSGRGPEDVA
jgi:hypothetical protein